MTRGEHGGVAQRQVSQREEVTETQTRPEKRFPGLISVCLGFFVIQLDVTIVNVALPAIQGQVGGSVGGLQWVIDAYTLAGLTGGFITAGEQGRTAPLAGALLAAGVAAGLLLVRAERRREAPMLPLRLFRSVNLSAATGVGILFNLCLYGALICLSLFLQQARHESALATGLLILPMSVAVGVGSVASGPLTARFGARIPMTAGLALAGAGATLLAAGHDAPLAMITVGSVLLGLCSLAMPAMTAVVVGSAGREHAGLASGILNAARQAGGALGVAILGALFASSQTGGQGTTLHLPLTVAAVGYLLAIGLTLAIRTDR